MPQEIEFFCNWPEEELNLVDDIHLLAEAAEYKAELEDEWNQL